jgi:hypothetical protein
MGMMEMDDLISEEVSSILQTQSGESHKHNSSLLWWWLLLLFFSFFFFYFSSSLPFKGEECPCPGNLIRR